MVVYRSNLWNHRSFIPRGICSLLPCPAVTVTLRVFLASTFPTHYIIFPYITCNFRFLPCPTVTATLRVFLASTFPTHYIIFPYITCQFLNTVDGFLCILCNRTTAHCCGICLHTVMVSCTLCMTFSVQCVSVLLCKV